MAPLQVNQGSDQSLRASLASLHPFPDAVNSRELTTFLWQRLAPRLSPKEKPWVVDIILYLTDQLRKRRHGQVRGTHLSPQGAESQTRGWTSVPVLGHSDPLQTDPKPAPCVALENVAGGVFFGHRDSTWILTIEPFLVDSV